MSAMSDQMTLITRVGPTGSVGCLTLDIMIVRRHPSRCRMVELADESNLNLISGPVAEFRPTWATTPQAFPAQKRSIVGVNLPCPFWKMEGLIRTYGRMCRAGGTKKHLNAAALQPATSRG